MNSSRISALRSRCAQAIAKYRIPLLVFLAGLALVLLPGAKTDAAPDETQTQTGFDLAATQAQLEQMLGRIEGAGRVQLMLTLQEGEQSVYQTDTRTVTDTGGTTQEADTVFRQSGSAQKQPVVQRVIYPRYQGALVVCDGADRPAVRLAIMEAVSSLTGLGSNKIAVVKSNGQ